ncbi:hypothetical protein [Bacillus sp. NPDC093026]|uniref:hypothetical protein n=1 Tax=Bacillus sp. NPDC093026 TaxID=3363948 RepID=UPI00382F6C17
MGITSAIVRLGKGIVEALLCKSIALTETWGENVLYLHTSDKIKPLFDYMKKWASSVRLRKNL